MKLTKSTKSEQWVMPDWMEQYRDLIESGCGGNSAESLMNREGATYFNNPILCELIGMCQAKVDVFEKLKKENLLLSRKKDDEI